MRYHYTDRPDSCWTDDRQSRSTKEKKKKSKSKNQQRKQKWNAFMKKMMQEKKKVQIGNSWLDLSSSSPDCLHTLQKFEIKSSS